ncbi:hypothetical protein GGX14DRAFT_558165 [Mycena pura]|uniref:Uncharacterized protein n=1 Tax=Mycena pura TaxID=153505 RepID=A0AAD7E2B4_9AGAR|nr:hypothetical protein GGX14DRAFT_558165 [Mycena pura]
MSGIADPTFLLAPAHPRDKKNLPRACDDVGCHPNYPIATALFFASYAYYARTHTTPILRATPIQPFFNFRFTATMVRFASTFLILACWAALISAGPVHKVKKDCTLMTDAQFGTLSQHAVDTINAQALTDHGDHSHRLVVNDPDEPQNPANVCDDLATGTVWVEYDSPVDGHFKWSYLFEDLLSTEDRAVD